jgi:hypothetical protein
VPDAINLAIITGEVFTGCIPDAAQCGPAICPRGRMHACVTRARTQLHKTPAPGTGHNSSHLAAWHIGNGKPWLYACAQAYTWGALHRQQDNILPPCRAVPGSTKRMGRLPYASEQPRRRVAYTSSPLVILFTSGVSLASCSSALRSLHPVA